MSPALSPRTRPLEEVDPELARAIDREVDRQARTLELIASENFVSEAVLQALGSVLTNKYAEGLPGKRYYGGCQFVDVAESLAIERAKKLFNAEHVNVQPHSGAQANQAVYMTTHKTLRGPRGGMVFSKAQYAKDLDKIVFPGIQGGPLMHVIAAKAVCLEEALQPDFREYQRQIVANAKVLAETLAAEGFRIVSGGTDNHLMLVDVFSKGMFGSEAEKALGEAGITVNKNAIPFDTNPPMKPSGIRIGTPAMTTRGMKETEMRQVGRWISEGLQHRSDSPVLGKIRKQVLQLAEAFPLYPERRAKAQAELRA